MAIILIVDDNPDVLHLMQLLLGSRGFEVASTLKGEETFNLINTFQPNLIFLDVHLAGMDGRQISRQLKTLKKQNIFPLSYFQQIILKELPWKNHSLMNL